MAFFAQKAKIIPVQCDRRIAQVLRRQPDLVVHFLAGHDQALRPAALTKSSLAGFVRSRALNPRPRHIERPGKWFR